MDVRDAAPLVRRRTRLTGLVVLASAVSLSSCALDGQRVRDAAVRPDEAPLVAARCPDRVADVEDSSAPGIVSGRRPTGFPATHVIRCSTETDDRGSGTVTVTVVVDEGPLSGAFEEALALPDQVFVRPDGAACTADGLVLPLLLITDGGARAYRPHLPVDACGKPRPAVARALDALPLTRTQTYVLTSRATR
jgi:hypothetical protein